MSANGQVLIVEQGSHRWELRSSWRAPFYVLAMDDADEPSEPLLIHCETREDAERKARLGGTVLGEFFETDTTNEEG